MTAVVGSSSMAGASGGTNGPGPVYRFCVHPPLPGIVWDVKLALTRSDRVGASSLSPDRIAGGESLNLLAGGLTMIRALLALAAGIGVGAGAMTAAHRHEDGEKVKEISVTDIKEKLDGKDARAT